MHYENVNQPLQPNSKWRRFSKPFFRYVVPAVTVPVIAATVVRPELDQSIPMHNSVGVFMSFNIGYLGGMGLTALAKKLENNGANRLSRYVGKSARAASWVGPIAVQLAGDMVNTPWSIGRSWPGVVAGIAATARGVMTGQYMANEGLNKIMEFAEYTEADSFYMPPANSTPLEETPTIPNPATWWEPYVLHHALPGMLPAPHSSNASTL